MKVSVDKEVDILYIRLCEDRVTEESEEVEPGVVLDFGADGEVVGVEIWNISQRVAPTAALVDARRDIASLATLDSSARVTGETLRAVEEKARAALAAAGGH